MQFFDADSFHGVKLTEPLLKGERNLQPFNLQPSGPRGELHWLTTHFLFVEDVINDASHSRKGLVSRKRAITNGQCSPILDPATVTVTVRTGTSSLTSRPEKDKRVQNEIMRIALLFCFVTSLIATVAAQDSPEKSRPSQNQTETSRTKRIEVEEFDKLRASKTNTVLDVRTEKEFKAGHIPGAINVDVNSPEFAQKLGQLDKSKTYLVHCGAGVRSARACKEMESLGFTNLYDLSSGFRGWEKAAKPVEKN